MFSLLKYTFWHLVQELKLQSYDHETSTLTTQPSAFPNNNYISIINSFICFSHLTFAILEERLQSNKSTPGLFFVSLNIHPIGLLCQTTRLRERQHTIIGCQATVGNKRRHTNRHTTGFFYLMSSKSIQKALIELNSHAIGFDFPQKRSLKELNVTVLNYFSRFSEGPLCLLFYSGELT